MKVQNTSILAAMAVGVFLALLLGGPFSSLGARREPPLAAPGRQALPESAESREAAAPQGAGGSLEARGDGGLEPSGLRLDVKKIAPADDAVRVGGAVSFEARLFRGNREIPAEGYVINWASDSGARFLDPVGPTVNTAIFTRPGRQAIEVTALVKGRDGGEPAAGPVVFEVAVGRPHFRLDIVPAKPLVGEEVRVEVRDFPLREGVEFRWSPLPGQARIIRVGEKDLVFSLDTVEPVEIKVAAVLSGAGIGGVTGADLGQVSGTVAAKAFAVKVDNRGAVGQKPIVWKDGEGPVETDRIAVGQKVLFRADIQPAPSHPPLSFSWKACPGAVLSGGDSGREVYVSREATGECRVEAEARDGRDLSLGSGAGSFEVGVGRAELERATALSAETARLSAEAESAWSAGEADKALWLADQATAINPSSLAAQAVRRRLAAERERLSSALAQAEEALSRDAFRRARGLLDEAATINARAPAIAETERRVEGRKAILERVEALLREADVLWEKGDVEGAVSLAGKALELDPRHPAAIETREAMVRGRDRMITALKDAAALAEAKRFESAAQALAEARGINTRFGPLLDMERSIRQRRDLTFRTDALLATAQDRWNAGDVDGALSALTETLKLDPAHVGAAEARGKMARAREYLVRAVDQAGGALAAKGPEAALASLDEARKLAPNYGPLLALERDIRDRVARGRKIELLKADVGRFLSQGDLDGALRAAEEIAGLDPSDRKYAAERDRLRRAAADMSAVLGQAEAHIAAGRFEQAKKTLAEAERLGPKNARAATLRERLATVRKTAEEEAASLLGRAEAKIKGNDFAGALTHLERLANLAGGGAERDKRLREAERQARAGLERQKAGERQAASRAMEAERKNRAASGRAECDDLARRAEDVRARGQHAKAITLYQDIVGRCPDYCLAYNNIGASLFKLGYAAESSPWFEEAVKCDPAQKLFRDNAALTRKKERDKTDKAASDRAPEKSCAEAFARADKRREGGDLTGAVKDYRQLLETCPSNCAAMNNIGLSLNKMGYVRESLPWFEEALKCDPKDTLFRENVTITTRQVRMSATPRAPGGG